MAFESQTYEAIMGRIMERVQPNLDKRASSPDWNASAPAAREMAILYTELDFILEATFADTAPREYLIRRAAERGISPYPATSAVLCGEFNIAVPLKARFSLENLNYTVLERKEEDDTPTTKAYRVQCETKGAVGNSQLGRLIPIDYIDGLTSAELVELLIPGDDDEETEEFRQRYIDSLSSQAFGGNRADYKEKVLAIPGVGAVKVFPAWNSGIAPQSFVPSTEVAAWYIDILPTLPATVAQWLASLYTAAEKLLLTVGGTVKLVVADSNFTIPSDELLADVQKTIDPQGSHGEGLGLAPIGHVIRVEGVKGVFVDVNLNLTYKADWDFNGVESYLQTAIDDYFLELAKAWQGSDSIVVRVSQIETRVLSCPGIVDVKDTTLNGSSDNIALDSTQIPVRGGVSG